MIMYLTSIYKEFRTVSHYFNFCNELQDVKAFAVISITLPWNLCLYGLNCLTRAIVYIMICHSVPLMPGFSSILNMCYHSYV